MLTYYVYAPLSNQLGALSLDVIWGFDATSSVMTCVYYLKQPFELAFSVMPRTQT